MAAVPFESAWDYVFKHDSPHRAGRVGRGRHAGRRLPKGRSKGLSVRSGATR